jgi:two-component system OmpR family response regulator
MRVLAVEDEPRLLDVLERGLTAAGYQVAATDNGEDAVVAADDEAVELVLLDIALGGMDGHEVLARIRARRPGLPVLMLTARDDLAHKVRALDAGADDYLTKPFAFEELLARIRALTRRADHPRGVMIEAGTVRLDLLARRAWRGDRALELSSLEFRLLEYFVRHPNQVLSRSVLLSAVWGYEYDPSSNIVDVYVAYLRRKLSEQGQPSPIVTMRGAGYRFDPALS